MIKYYVVGGSDTHWQALSAQTLLGAKRQAGAMYHRAVGGRIKIAEIDREREEYIPVSVCYDFGAWQDAI